MLAPEHRVAFYTLGCKLNFSESSALSGLLSARGFRTVPFERAADVYVINTCSVTENADRKCAQVVRRALRTSPQACVVVVGCYAQLKPAEIAELPGVDLVLGAAEKFRLADHLEELAADGRFSKHDHGCWIAGDISEVSEFSAARSGDERTRSFLKVQDGCDYGCAFCTIPLARGRSRSARIDDVLPQAQEAVKSGVREIVLTGVNIGDFGHVLSTAGQGAETGGPQRGERERFIDLIRALDEVPVDRFRISSIEPNLLDDAIIEFVARSQRFMPHFHVPLQSGSDRILGLMRRRYRSELYRRRVKSIRRHMPHACIGVDLIVGFPGETEADFMETFEFIHELAVDYLHVFPYSERDNTVAAGLPDPVPMAERTRRSRMLRNLSDKKRRAFHARHAGTTRPVLFEAKRSEQGLIQGFTDNYVKVTAATPGLVASDGSQLGLQDLAGSLRPILLGAPLADGSLAATAAQPIHTHSKR